MSFFASVPGFKMGANPVQQDGRRGWWFWAETPRAVGLKGWLYVGADEAAAREAFAKRFAAMTGETSFEIHTAEAA